MIVLDRELCKKLSLSANDIRRGIIEGTFNAKSGHPGGSLSIAELLAYLYFHKMNIDPADPKAEYRDRLVLSKGHAAPALYSALAYRGFFPVDDLKTLRHADSYLQGHPNMNYVPGVDMSTGSLGQGCSAAVGMALASKLKGDAFHVYTVLGDGEIEEGQVWEAAMFAGNKKLDTLTFFIDYNKLQIDGSVEEVNSPEPIDEKFRAFGFNVIVIDGNDLDQIDRAVDDALNMKGKPTAVVMNTVKGCGISFMENQIDWHGKAPNKDQYDVAMAELDAKQTELESL